MLHDGTFTPSNRIYNLFITYSKPAGSGATYGERRMRDIAAATDADQDNLKFTVYSTYNTWNTGVYFELV